MKSQPCYCSAYNFPHRIQSGSCTAQPHEQLCSDCRLPSGEQVVDFGIGSYECHGARGWHSDKQEVSACCEAEFVENTYINFNPRSLSKCP